MKATRLPGLARVIGFAAALLLAACSTDTAAPEPNVQTTDFTVFVLATSQVEGSSSALQATPWTLESETGEDAQGQGRAVGENPLISERVHTMQVSAQPGDEMTLDVTTGAGETAVGPFTLFDGAQPASGEVFNQGDLTVVATPNSAVGTTSLESASVEPVTFNDVKLSGDAEVPPALTDASGEAALLLIDRLLFAVGRFEGLQGELFEVQGSPAHIHQGAADENGDIVFNLGVAANAEGDGFFTGLGGLEEAEVERLQAGELYINIHSTFSETGELRGQITGAEQGEPGEDDENDEGARTLNVAESGEFGPYVTDDAGNSLYLFTNDTRGANESTCNGECAETWPPVTLGEGKTVSVAEGSGLGADLLRSFERKDGSTQVTYNGWPLYRFSGDEEPGDTNGTAVNLWFLVTPDGDEIVGSGAPSGDLNDASGRGN